jgi:hypothetical protein
MKTFRSSKRNFNFLHYIFLFLFFFSFPTYSWAQNQLNNTRTINIGMGVNPNQTNRNLNLVNENGIACAGQNQSNCQGGPFADTSDPFNLNHDCSNTSTSSSVCASSFDSQLSGGFALVDNRFGRGSPCGPNDPNGPPFPYPCHSPGTINQITPLGMDDPNTNFIQSPPTLGTSVGQPFYQFRSDTFGTLRVNHIEYGFNQSGDAGGTQVLRVFYVIDSVTDGNGNMVGNATGTFQLQITDGFAGCNVNAANLASSGTFESGMTGVITCVDRGGAPCQSTQFMPGKFAESGNFRFNNATC